MKKIYKAEGGRKFLHCTTWENENLLTFCVKETENEKERIKH